LFVVHVADGVADLTHEVNTLSLSQHVVVTDDSLEQLTTSHTAHKHQHQLLYLFTYSVNRTRKIMQKNTKKNLKNKNTK